MNVNVPTRTAERIIRMILSLILLAGMCLPEVFGRENSAYAATTGYDSGTILIRYGKGADVLGTWNESVLTVDGEWAYCVQVDSHFQSGLHVSERDPVASGIWSQDLCTELALIVDFIDSGEFVSTGTFGFHSHKVTSAREKYAVAQCYIWKALDDAGYSDYGWFSATVDDVGLIGNDTDGQVREYVNENFDDYIGRASYFDCGNSQDVACNFSLEPAKGRIELTKRSENESFVEGNASYSLTGARYGVFEDEKCAGSPTATLVTDERGHAESDPITRGDYFIREMEASTGYEIDPSIYPVTVMPNETVTVNGDMGYVLETPLTGGLSLEKDSALPDITLDNDCYSNEGAVYSVYGDEACQNKLADMTTDRQGRASVEGLPLGPKFVREAIAPKGMALDETVYRCTVKPRIVSDVRASSLLDVPKSCIVDLLLVKHDAQKDPSYQENHPQAAATLEGALFEFHYYDGFFGSIEEARASGNPTRAWTFETDAQGLVRLDDAHLAEGDALYHDRDGNVCLPLGTITMREIKPPTGYLLGDWSECIQITDDDANGEHVQGYAAPSVADMVRRGDLELVKVSASTMNRLSNVPFRITSATTGESHVIVTDENGYASTSASWNAHSSNTNGNDGATWGPPPPLPEGATGNQAEIEPAPAANDSNEPSAKADQTDAPANPYNPHYGIWFGMGDDGQTSLSVNDELGALPFDTYTIEELPCPANEGLQLVQTSIVISRDKAVVDLGTIDDPSASIGTQARDTADADSIVAASEKTTIIDRVSYSGLIPGREYTMHGKLVDRESEKPLFDDGGNEIESSMTFVPEAPDGSVEMDFQLSTTALAGKTLVAFEELLESGRSIAVHAEIDDFAQSVIVDKPEIKTQAMDAKSGTPVVSKEATAEIVDRVSYSGLNPGSEYTIRGTLIDKETKKPLGEPDEIVCSESTFVAEHSSGEIAMTFSFDASQLDDKTRLVVFETLSSNDGIIATHEDVEDERQTITVREPELATTLIDMPSKSKMATVSGAIRLTDIVEFHGLVVGRSYDIEGILMDKESGKPIENAKGEPVVSKITFEADAPSGSIEVPFEFDGSALAGHEVVAFESLFQEGREVATHANLNDEDQTVSINAPRIRTVATNKADGSKVLPPDNRVKIIDDVSVNGVTPGREYLIVGLAMEKASKVPLFSAPPTNDTITPSPEKDNVDASESERSIETKRGFWKDMLSVAGLESALESEGIAIDEALQIDMDKTQALFERCPHLASNIAMQTQTVEPQESTFNVQMEIPIETMGLAGQIVIFEALVEAETGKLIAVHAQYDDVDQTLEIEQERPRPEEVGHEPIPGKAYDKTGNMLKRYSGIAALVAAVGLTAGIYGAIRLRRIKSLEIHDAAAKWWKKIHG